MTAFILAVLLWAVRVTALAQAPPDGPYAKLPGHVCYRGEELAGRKMHHCECRMTCVGGEPRGGTSCVTYCGTKQCLCHADEACGMPDVGPARPR